VGGIGVGVLAIGGILGLIAIGNMSAASEPDACIGIYCSPDGIDAIDRAKVFAEAGQWVGIGGLMMVGIGATLILTSPSGSSPARTGTPGSTILAGARVRPLLGPSGAGVSLEGRLW
jgi:hypothetical protein